jgi:tape measure domain-containing protein
MTATDILRTIIRCDGAETVARQFGNIGKAAGEAELRLAAAADKAGNIANVSGAIGIGMLAAAGGLLKAAGAAEQAQIAFTTLLKSPQEAKKHLQELAQFAANTPFEFAGLRTLSTQLLAFGFQSQQVIPMLRSIGDAGSSLGLGQEGLSRMIRAVGQIQAKGRVQMQELLQLAEAGVPVFQILQEELGLTASQVGEIGRQGVYAKDGIAALLRGMDKRYGGGMEAQSKTLIGTLSNLKDQAGLLAMEMGATLIPTMADATDTVQRWTKALRTAPDWVKKLIAGFLLFGGIGALLLSVGARMTQIMIVVQLSAAMKKRAAIEAIAMERAEQLALDQTAAAYARKAAAASQAYLTGQGSIAAVTAAQAQAQAAAAAAVAGPQKATGGGMLALRRSAGMAVGVTMGLVRAGQAMAADDPAEKMQRAGAAAGYLAGAFNPLILAATALAEIIGAIVEGHYTKQAKQTAQRVGNAPGVRDGAPITDPKQLAAQFAEPEYSIMPAAYFMREVRKNQARVKRQADAAQAQLAAAQAAQTADEALAAAETTTAREKAKASLFQAQNGQPAQQGIMAALFQEADAHEKTAASIKAQAAAEGDEIKKKEMLTEAEKHATDAIADRAEATGLAADAIKRQGEAEKKATEEAQKAHAARIDALRTWVGYVGTTGSTSQQAGALTLLGKVLDNEAELQLQAGDVASAYRTKTEAANAYTEALKVQNSALTDQISIGNAYAQYLDSIGAKDEADRLRQTTIAGLAATEAQTLFGQGNILGGLQAATEAERLARSGMDDKGGLGFGGGRSGAMTGALNLSQQQAINRSISTQLNLNMYLHAYDEAGTERARGQRTERMQYYAAHG